MRALRIVIVAALISFGSSVPAVAQVTTGPVTITSKPVASTRATDVTFVFRYDGPFAPDFVYVMSALGRPGDWVPGDGVTETRYDTCVSPCSLTREFRGLAEGTWTFKVRAAIYRNAGYQSFSPVATHTFTVDRVAPIVKLTATPPLNGTDTSATVAFAADEPSTFVCDLDGQTSACTSPQTYAVGVGEHRFSVTAADEAGNTGPPASTRWVVTPTLSISTPQFTGIRWRQSQLEPGAALDITGTLTASGYSASTTWALTHVGSPNAAISLNATVFAPAFATRLTLPATTLRGGALLVPGEYRVLVTGTAAGFILAATPQTARMPSPPEGVVTDAGISTSADGPALHRVTSARRLWATFRFAPSATAPRPVHARWRAPNGKTVARVNFRARRNALVTWYGRPGRNLAKGRWTCMLMLGRTVIKRVSIRVGS